MRPDWLLIAGVVGLAYGCANSQPGFPGQDVAAAPAAKAAAEEPAGPNAAQFQPDRKIIYTAEVVLVTENLDEFRRRLTAALQQGQGFITAEQLTGRMGSQRTGVWTVRVAVDQFSKFLEQLSTWGELERQQLKSEDVTEEFVDVETRIKNKRVEEQRLLDILQNKTGELEQVVALERAISEVREQIERMEGRMRYLSNRTEFTTITLTVREVQNYVPPQPPTLTTEITRTFQASLRELVEFGKILLLLLVAVAPWLLVAAVLLAPLIWLLRRLVTPQIPYAEEAKPPSAT